jgi:hypothetical protein
VITKSGKSGIFCISGSKEKNLGLAMEVGVVDYNAGNLTSVETALAHLGAEYVLSKDPKKLIGTTN